MEQAAQHEAKDHEFKEIAPQEAPPAQHLALEDLDAVNLYITVDLGVARMLVRDILKLVDGSIVPLNKMAGELTDILVNGLPFAKGEVVVIGDSLHIRIAEILGTGDLLEE